MTLTPKNCLIIGGGVGVLAIAIGGDAAFWVVAPAIVGAVHTYRSEVMKGRSERERVTASAIRFLVVPSSR